MEKVMDLLKGNFWILDLARVRLSPVELDFLKYFFDFSFDRVIDDLTLEEKVFLVLKKKGKFIQNPFRN